MILKVFEAPDGQINFQVKLNYSEEFDLDSGKLRHDLLADILKALDLLDAEADPTWLHVLIIYLHNFVHRNVLVVNFAGKVHADRGDGYSVYLSERVQLQVVVKESESCAHDVDVHAQLATQEGDILVAVLIQKVLQGLCQLSILAMD